MCLPPLRRITHSPNSSDGSSVPKNSDVVWLALACWAGAEAGEGTARSYLQKDGAGECRTLPTMHLHT